ncbi:MAG: WYL domain-containing protein [Cyanobacteria bacterium SIG30]|nr:WYL domain-containing protein [Cyanobacteria bacterium SIG30]
MTENKPRYSRISDILDLATFMASKVSGVTINEIATRYNVSRRTAERMRDSLICIFPTIDEIETEDSHKHWGFTNYSISHLIHFDAKEIANIEQLQRRTTNKEMKEELKKTVEKIKVLNHKNLNSIEDNVALFLETEGYAVRQMPQYKISLDIIDTIREALQNSKMVTANYHDKERLLEPLGLIYGEKIYLIAREKAKGKGIFTYLLHKFRELKIMDKTFNKKDFNLQEYTNESFGVYHGKILDVELLFSKEIAKDASLFNFHPTQSGKINKDGTYSLTFKASGSKEIIRHVFRWGAGCKIVSPKSLKDEYRKNLEECLQMNKTE